MLQTDRFGRPAEYLRLKAYSPARPVTNGEQLIYVHKKTITESWYTVETVELLCSWGSGS